jgi:TPR repeat protein
MRLTYFSARRVCADQPRSRLRRLQGIALAGSLFVAAVPYAAAITTATLSTAASSELLAPFKENDLLEDAFREGVNAYEVGDYDTAARSWRMPAERGHAGAQFSLGVAYATGRGVEQSLDRAIGWWQEAAAQGHLGAQLNLGLIYWRGEGVQKDLDKARMWWQQAATGGDPAAQFHLGALAAMGEGEPRNYKEAMKWWRLSAAQGYRQAIKGLEILKNHGAASDDESARDSN